MTSSFISAASADGAGDAVALGAVFGPMLGAQVRRLVAAARRVRLDVAGFKRVVLGARGAAERAGSPYAVLVGTGSTQHGQPAGTPVGPPRST